ncbi:MAG TPA: tetratricopeptide repeat protein, partial [Thermoanaerobaculia bacterium]|nr:tetratricopeptide repeat protein [Thermoanaerobaculia bacterium]
FFLALILGIANSLTFVRVVQSMLGALACVLVAKASARHFGRRAGIITGGILAIYAPLVWIDTSILAESLLLFLLACILYFSDRPVVAGLLIGLATITRPTALVLLPLLLVMHRKRALPIALVTLLPIVPVTFVNYRTTGHFIPVQAYGGMNVYLGNSPHGNGLASARLGGTWDALQHEQDFLGKTAREIKDAPLAYLALLAKKTLWLVQNDEVRDSHSFYFFASQSFVLRCLPTFAILFALAAVGFLQADRRPWFLVAWLIAFALTCIFLVVGARYRMPMIPVLAMFAGAVQVPQKRRDAIAVAVIAAVAIAITFVRRHDESHRFAEEYSLSGLSLIHERKLEAAESAYRSAIEIDPRSALAWDGLGIVAFNRGNFIEAEEYFRHALAINPEYEAAQRHLRMANDQ